MTEGEEHIAGRDELAAAIAEAGQRQTTVGFRWAGGFITHPAQLAALPPLGARRRPPLPPPSTPSSMTQRHAGTEGLAVVSEPADDDVAVPGLSGNDNLRKPIQLLSRVNKAEQVGGVSVQLDIAVERQRWFWWRLALRLVARRLR
jgi:hypothetical protein